LAPGGHARLAAGGLSVASRAGRLGQQQVKIGGRGRWTGAGYRIPPAGRNCPERIGEFWSYPKTRTFAEPLIDCEVDRTLRAVLVGILREADRGL
jgi:hypothetical protein